MLLGLSWLGLRGWRWLFILEGIPAIVFGIITIWYLTDWPAEAKWLPEDEKAWITQELKREKEAKKRSYRIWEALRHRDVILLTLCYFGAMTGSYGIAFWLPTILKRLSGQSDLRVTLMAALPYVAAVCHAAGERLAFRSDARAPLACRCAGVRMRIGSRLRGSLSWEPGIVACTFRCRRRIVLWLSARVLGGAYAVSLSLGRGRIDWAHQFGRKPGRLRRPHGHGLSSQTNPHLFCRLAVSGGEFVRLRHSHADSGPTPDSGRKLRLA